MLYTVLGDGDAYGQWMFDENGGQCLSLRGGILSSGTFLEFFSVEFEFCWLS